MSFTWTEAKRSPCRLLQADSTQASVAPQIRARGLSHAARPKGDSRDTRGTLPRRVRHDQLLRPMNRELPLQHGRFLHGTSTGILAPEHSSPDPRISQTANKKRTRKSKLNPASPLRLTVPSSTCVTLQRLHRAVLDHTFVLAAFLIPLAIRSVPEIIVGLYPAGFDTISYCVLCIRERG